MATKARICESLWSGLLDDSGHPMSGGKVWTYESGTTTPKDMWLDRDKTSLATNPIILDTFGRAEVYGDGLYKFVVMDPDDVVLYDVDEIELIAAGGNYTIDTLQVGDTVIIDSILDEDNFASNSATAVPTQQSTRAYIASSIAANNLNTFNSQGGAEYTLALADANKQIIFTSNSAVTLNVPLASSVNFNIGTQIDLIQNGDGKVTINPADGVTINSNNSLLSIGGKYIGVMLIKISTDTWQLYGSLTE